MSDLILIAALALGTWPPDQPKGNTYKLFQRYGQLDLADSLQHQSAPCHFAGVSLPEKSTPK